MKNLLLSLAMLSLLAACKKDEPTPISSKSTTTNPIGNCLAADFFINGKLETKFEYNSKKQLSRVLYGFEDNTIDEIREFSYIDNVLLEFNPDNNTTVRFNINSKNAITQAVEEEDAYIDSIFYVYSAENLLNSYTINRYYKNSAKKDVFKTINTFENGNTKDSKDYKNDTLINTSTYEYYLDKIDKSNFGAFNCHTYRLFSGFYGSGNKNLIKKLSNDTNTYSFAYTLNAENYIQDFTSELINGKATMGYLCN